MKKFLALVLAVLMVATTGVVVMTASAADTTPVALFDGAELNTGDSYCLNGTYSYASGFVRYTWFDQSGAGGSGTDPQLWLHKTEWGNLNVGPYMVIKYKTNTAGLQGCAFIGNGTVGQSKTTWDYSVADGSWATVMIYLPDDIDGYYDLDQNQITHFRWDVVENATSAPNGTLDVEYVAFFDTEEDALGFQHETKPVDPDTPVGGSYRTYDFTTATDLSQLMGSYFEMSATLVDGALRITANGADPYAKLLNNGSDELGISGLQARYILVKYKTSTTIENPQIKFFSNVPGVAGWGQPGSYTNGDNLTADGNWHYVMVDASSAWGTHNVGLNAFRIDALDAANTGDTIDIASIKFFTTSDWVNSYIVGLAETDTAAKEMGLAYGWIAADPEPEPEPEPEPDPEPTVMLGDVTGDGIVNTKDLTRLKKYLSSAGDGSVVLDEAASDVTGDGIVNTKDMTRLKKYLSSAGDGSVELG